MKIFFKMAVVFLTGLETELKIHEVCSMRKWIICHQNIFFTWLVRKSCFICHWILEMISLGSWYFKENLTNLRNFWNWFASNNIDFHSLFVCSESLICFSSVCFALVQYMRPLSRSNNLCTASWADFFRQTAFKVVLYSALPTTGCLKLKNLTC